MHSGVYYLENWAIFFQYSDITSQLSNPAYGKKGARGTEKREVVFLIRLTTLVLYQIIPANAAIH